MAACWHRCCPPMLSVDAGWLLLLYTRISSCSWSGHNFLIGINDNMPSSLQLDGRTTHWFPVAECLWISAALLCYFFCPYAIWYTVLKPHRHTNASLLNSREKVNILEYDTTLKQIQLKLFIFLLFNNKFDITFNVQFNRMEIIIINFVWFYFIMMHIVTVGLLFVKVGLPDG